MNERLRELADQAGFIRFSPEEDPRTPIDWSSDYEHELKHFAELIIKECCQYLNGEAERLYALSATEHRPNFKEDFEICAEKCYDNIQGIKEHFGVEQ